jgi:hypothetical protein
MSLLPRALLKNYSQDALKPLEDECNAFDKVDFFSSPQAASHNVSIQSNRTQLVGTVGKIPNLFGFHNVDLERLRKEKKFLALPPESWLDFTKDEQSHRLCRQGTNTWASLHKGVLTSGNILGALGFKEAHVVTKIGLHSESASHQDLMRAVMVMREDAAAVVEAPSTTGENERDEDDAREKNEAIVKAYNEELMLSVEEERNDGWYDNDSDDDDDEMEEDLSASSSAAEDEEDEDEEDNKEEKFFPPIKNSKGRFQHHFDFSSATPLDILRASVDNSHVNRSTKKSPAKIRTNNAKKGSKKQKKKKAKQLKKKKKKARELAGVEEQPFGGTLGLTRLGFCRMKAREGEQSVRLAWGNTAEAGALMQLLNDFPNVEEIHEVGLCRMSKDVLLKYEEMCGCKLPQLGASPDAIALIRSDDGENAVERVVVEVKNRSPFYRTQSGYYRVGDPPLPKTIPAYHVPQVQLEMVSANASSCFLCMRNVTRGTSVFRVKRDEEYLKQMFRVIGRLYENYCLKDDAKSPPENWLANDPIHALLVRKTRDIAQNAQLVTILAPSSSSSFDDDDDEKEHENKDGKNGEERESFHPFLDEYLARGRS